MEQVQEKSDVLKKRLDLTKILVNLHNFEQSFSRVFESLSMEANYERSFEIMDRWRQEDIEDSAMKSPRERQKKKKKSNGA